MKYKLLTIDSIKLSLREADAKILTIMVGEMMDNPIKMDGDTLRYLSIRNLGRKLVNAVMMLPFKKGNKLNFSVSMKLTEGYALYELLLFTEYEDVSFEMVKRQIITQLDKQLVTWLR